MLAIYSPFNREQIGSIEFDPWDRINAYLDEAQALKHPRSQIPLKERVILLERAAEEVETRLEEFARSIAEEGGKPLVDARVEVQRAVQTIREAAIEAQRIVGQEVPMRRNEASAGRLAFTVREPIGLVFGISAFNHPLNLIVHQAITAFAVGCPAIIKPALETPLTCKKFFDALYGVGVPSKWLRMVVCENEVAQKIAEDSRINFLSFIGSAKVGWMLRQKIAPGVRCALEHGGVAPVVVAADANFNNAIPAIVKGGFYHAGQVCVSVQRIFVETKIYQKFAEELVASVEKLRVGDPLNEKTDIGPLIRVKEMARIVDWVEEAKQSGGKVLTGGKALSETCFAPTVISNPSLTCRISREEVFGPVVSLYEYESLEQAINLANSLPFAFQASIFSENVNTCLLAARHLNASSVMINEHTAFRVDWMPFGGRLQSGLGVGGVAPSMHELTQEKMIVMKSPSML